MTQHLAPAEINVSWWVRDFLSRLPIGATFTADAIAGKLPVEVRADTNSISSCLAIMATHAAQELSRHGTEGHLRVYRLEKPVTAGKPSRRPRRVNQRVAARTNGHAAPPQPRLALPPPATSPGSLASQLLDIAGKVETMQRDLLQSMSMEALLDEIARRRNGRS